LIRVLQPGLLSTVQDLGRHGFARYGISPAGAADPLSLRIANRLAGNPDNAPGLEFTLTGPALQFATPAAAALAGSDFSATLDGQPIALHHTFSIQPGQTLACPATRSGARCYLAVHGGLEIPLLLGSASTHLPSRMGGLDGRALRKGDILHFQPTTRHPPLLQLNPAWLQRWFAPSRLGVSRGPHHDDFPQAAIDTFYSSPFLVTEQSNRSGLRLAGPNIPAPFHGEMLTAGVSLGAIQIPPNGQPILMFMDQQTTGGYPILANLISAHLHLAGQLRPRQSAEFEPVSLDAARRLLAQLEHSLDHEALEPQ
jgi:antagonist of KipI